ncbi:MAG: oxidoreductase [Elusimicrobia bacterium]|nr:oxidoreductase [Elusimicrobiota bacterium]
MMSVPVLILLAGAAASAALGRRTNAAASAYLASLVAGCASGLALALSGAGLPALDGAWSLPSARLAASVDPLSALFLPIVLSVCLPAGIYGEAYMRRSAGLADSRSLRPLFLILTAALVVVVCARNALLFLFAWEAMALASFFLIVAEDREPATRRAGLLYFVCTRVATLSLFLLFALLGRRAGTFDFDGIRAALRPDGRLAAAALALGFLGFGMKAGLAPLHVWLQEAHPAAPSHVSAVLSGVVIKVGIYGFLRLIWLLGTVPDSWGLVLVLAGAVSGIGGVLFALAQHDLKRLLAYHSVENVGIIALGLGVGCLGLSRGRTDVALLGFAGAGLHSLNHALFKSLLFLGSGSFYQALGTRDVEAGGGLLKAMPWTSGLALLAAAAICGLPPLNGFVSEWLVYMASTASGARGGAGLAAASVGSLALIGGLALACFTKAYGALCLGAPRTEAARAAVDPGPLMLGPMAALAAACAFIGLAPAPAVGLAGRAAAAVCGVPAEAAALALAGPLAGARLLGGLGAGVLAAAGLLAFWRSRLVGARAASGPTWACGFAAATARARYSASSFAQPLTRAFDPLLGARLRAAVPEGYWPATAAFSTHTPDRVLDGLLLPAGAAAADALAWAKVRLSRRLQYHMLLVSLCLLMLLFWKL